MATSRTKAKISRTASKARATRPNARGFRFGPVWLKSIKAQSGAALRASNKDKLLATAAANGVKVNPKTDQATIVERLASRI